MFSIYNLVLLPFLSIVALLKKKKVLLWKSFGKGSFKLVYNKVRYNFEKHLLEEI